MAIVGPVQFVSSEGDKIRCYVWYDDASTPTPKRVTAVRAVNEMPKPVKLIINNRSTGQAQPFVLNAGQDTGQVALGGGQGQAIYYDYVSRAQPGTWGMSLEYPAP